MTPFDEPHCAEAVAWPWWSPRPLPPDARVEPPVLTVATSGGLL